MRLLNLASAEAVEWADKQVEEAYTVWQKMVLFDFPENQILAIQDELDGRIIEAKRIKMIYERLESKRNGRTKKHR